jgi:hypothetical protein
MGTEAAADRVKPPWKELVQRPLVAVGARQETANVAAT